MTWLIVALVGIAVAAVLVAGLRVRHRRPRPPVFTARLAGVAVHPCDNPRANCFVRCELILVNHVEQPVVVSDVHLAVQGAQGGRLHPKETCGTESRHVGQRHHPAHLATCLPLALPGLSRRSYTFDAFFGHRLVRGLPGAELCATIRLENGDEYALTAPLPAPTEEP
jgi:hypothetical protein